MLYKDNESITTYDSNLSQYLKNTTTNTVNPLKKTTNPLTTGSASIYLDLNNSNISMDSNNDTNNGNVTNEVSVKKQYLFPKKDLENHNVRDLAQKSQDLLRRQNGQFV